MKNSYLNGKVIWLTGLSGAGKTTIAHHLKLALEFDRYQVCILDGDELRNGLNRDLGFSNSDRSENIRRTVEVAKIIKDTGLVVIVALISPFTSDRQYARSKIGKQDFIEIYVSTPLEVCESRDPKELYKKARKGLITDMTGLESIYEIPENPELEIDTSKITILENISKIKKFLMDTSRC